MYHFVKRLLNFQLERGRIEKMEIGKIEPVKLTDEVQKAYLDYAMSVIVSRALPDVRDGLKPVHRRILYAMHQMNLHASGKFSKSAKVVGEVLGKYHPHGDQSVYDALVRMAQDFSMRYPLIKGQGNFGSVDGDPPAAMRYTEVKLAKIASTILTDLDKETVPFTPNFDGSLKEPDFLPAALPNLLLMGAEGIAVGMATRIPPHNLAEVVEALIFMISKSQVKETVSAEVTVEELMNFIQGPDFPTAGQLYDWQELKNAYLTGRGKIVIRGQAEITEEKKKPVILITQLPYQVNKAELVAKIAQYAKEKRLKGIADLRDESDREGMRIVIELKKNAKPKAVLNNLFKYTQLQTIYPINIVALKDGVPKTLNLKAILLAYLNHRLEMIEKRSRYELNQAQQRTHILAGLKIALENIDAVIDTIKKSKDPTAAKKALMEKFNLTEIQASAILEMPLKRLSGLEREKIEDEYQLLQELIAYLNDLLAHPEKILKVIKRELEQIKEKYGDSRKTKVFKRGLKEFKEEDLIAKKRVLMTITKTGYIKRVSPSVFKLQRRGGKGVLGMSTKEEDEIKDLLFANTHDYVLFFTDQGKVYQLRAWDIPEASRRSQGKAIVNLINKSQEERVTSILIHPETKQQGNKATRYILMATKKGKIKKTSLSQFKNIRSSGLIAINLKKDDQLGWVKLTDGQQQVILITHQGKGIKFSEKDVRPMGRATEGVKGISLKKDNYLVGMEVFAAKPKKLADKRKKNFHQLLTISEKGVGKRTAAENFPLQKRGGLGVWAARTSKKTGSLICAKLVTDKIDKLVLTSKKGQIIKVRLNSVPVLGRATQGVILMRFSQKNDQVAAATCIKKEV